MTFGAPRAERPSDELDKLNAAATEGVAPSRELTVQILDDKDLRVLKPRRAD
jgi:hypothetical protein